MSNQPRFLPPEGKKEFHLATTDGHSCVIHEVCPVDKKPGTVIPERFRKIAGVATDTIELSTRIMKKPMTRAHNAGQGDWVVSAVVFT